MIPNNIQVKLFYEMLKIRNVELKIAELYPEEEMRCPVHLSVGQEGVAVGVCTALKKRDKVLCGHRSHAYYLAKGGNLKGMLAEIYGKSSGIVNGMGGSQHLVDMDAGLIAAVPIVGSTIPIAVGSAWGSSMKNKNKVTAAFFGEGATETGVFHESLNFAALHKIPIIFICENNQFSVYSHLDVRQSSNRDNTKIAMGYGIHALKGDGNNVGEVYNLTKEAISIIESGNGPVYMEFDTFRWLEHCGPIDDDHLGYRNEEEIKKWKEKCPVKFQENLLLKKGIVDSQEINRLSLKLDKEIQEAVNYAKSSSFAKKELLFTTVYSN